MTDAAHLDKHATTQLTVGLDSSLLQLQINNVIMGIVVLALSLIVDVPKPAVTLHGSQKKNWSDPILRVAACRCYFNYTQFLFNIETTGYR